MTDIRHVEPATFPEDVRTKPGVITFIGRNRPEGADQQWQVVVRFPFADWPAQEDYIRTLTATKYLSIQHIGTSVEDLTASAVGLVVNGPPLDVRSVWSNVVADFYSITDLDDLDWIAEVFLELLKSFVRELETRPPGTVMGEAWRLLDPVKFAYLSLLLMDAVAFYLTKDDETKEAPPSDQLPSHLDGWCERQLRLLESDSSGAADLTRRHLRELQDAIKEAVRLRASGGS
jgi:hypothetical protein